MSVCWTSSVCILRAPPPISTTCGSNISTNVFLIKAASAARMNMVRIHRQISPFPPTCTCMPKHTHSTHTTAHAPMHWHLNTCKHIHFFMSTCLPNKHSAKKQHNDFSCVLLSVLCFLVEDKLIKPGCWKSVGMCLIMCCLSTCVC